MSIRVRSEELKQAAKLTSQIKDVTAGVSKKYLWTGLHRLLVKDNQFVLYTNDGACWLKWNIQMEEPSDDNYDVILSATQFYDIISKSSGDTSFEIRREDSKIIFTKGSREIPLREEPHKNYSEYVKRDNLPEDHSFIVPSSVLAKNIKFALPFIDANNATATKTVVTWTNEGRLICGSSRQSLCISGMPCPPFDMSFKQGPAKSVIAFLNALEGDVIVTVDGKEYVFECPVKGHQLKVSGESVFSSVSMKDLDKEPCEVFQIEAGSLLECVSIINSVLPPDIDRLKIKIKGSHEDSKLRVSTLDDESGNPKEEFDIIRDIFLEDVICFDFNCRVFEDVLSRMAGSILEGRYYPERKTLVLEDERVTEEDTIRNIIIPVGKLVIAKEEVTAS